MTQNPYGQERVRKGVGHYVTGRAFAAVASMIVVLLLVRLMTVQDYGVFVTATGAATILVMLSVCGLDRVILKFVPEGRLQATPRDLSRFLLRLISMRMGAAIAFIVPVCAAQEWLLPKLQIPVSNGVLLATVSYALMFAFTDFAVYCLQALMLQKQLRLSVSIAWLIRLAAVGFLMLTHGKVDSLSILWIWAAAECVAALILLAPLLKIIQQGRGINRNDADSTRWPPKNAALRNLAISNFLSTLVGIPWQPYALRTLAAALLPANQVAAYGFYQILIERIRGYLPVYFFASLTEPLMAAHLATKGQRQEALDYMSLLIQFSVWMLAPLVTLFLCLGDPVLGMLAGGKYRDFSPLLAVLLCQVLLGIHVTMLWSFFSVMGESKTIWRAVTIPSLTIFPLLIYCGSRFGILGMALAAPINTVGIFTLMLIRVHQMELSYPIRWQALFRIALNSALFPLPALCITTMIGPISQTTLLIILVASGIGYIALSAWLTPFDKDQADWISRFFPAINGKFRWLNFR